MEDPKVLERMRADWNERAGEDANYYVAFGRREQDDEEFFATAADIVKGLRVGSETLPRARRRARDRLRPRPPDAPAQPPFRRDPRRRRLRRDDPPGPRAAARHAQRPPASQLGLRPRHVPRRRSSISSTPTPSSSTFPAATWSSTTCAKRGASSSPAAFCAASSTACRRTPSSTTPGAACASRPDEIRAVRARAGFPAARARGDLDAVHVDHLPQTGRGLGRLAGSHSLDFQRAHSQRRQRPFGRTSHPVSRKVRLRRALVRGAPARLRHQPSRGPDRGTTRQSDLYRPAGLGRGGAGQRSTPRRRSDRPVLPVEVAWMGKALCDPAVLRVIPPAPLVPRLCSLSDGVNLLSGTTISSGTVKVTMEEVPIAPAVFRHPGIATRPEAGYFPHRSGQPPVRIQLSAAGGSAAGPAPDRSPARPAQVRADRNRDTLRLPPNHMQKALFALVFLGSLRADNAAIEGRLVQPLLNQTDHGGDADLPGFASEADAAGSATALNGSSMPPICAGRFWTRSCFAGRPPSGAPCR